MRFLAISLPMLLVSACSSGSAPDIDCFPNRQEKPLSAVEETVVEDARRRFHADCDAPESRCNFHVDPRADRIVIHADSASVDARLGECMYTLGGHASFHYALDGAYIETFPGM